MLGRRHDLARVKFASHAPGTSRGWSASGPLCHVTQSDTPGWLRPAGGYRGDAAGEHRRPSGHPRPGGPAELQRPESRGPAGDWPSSGPRAARCGPRPGSSSGTPPSPPRTPRSFPASPRRWPGSGRTSRGGGPRWAPARGVGWALDASSLPGCGARGPAGGAGRPSAVAPGPVTHLGAPCQAPSRSAGRQAPGPHLGSSARKAFRGTARGRFNRNPAPLASALKGV